LAGGYLFRPGGRLTRAFLWKAAGFPNNPHSLSFKKRSLPSSAGSVFGLFVKGRRKRRMALWIATAARVGEKKEAGLSVRLPFDNAV